MAQLTTTFLPELVKASATAAAIRGQGPDGVHAAVFGDIDQLFDYVLVIGDNAATDATRDADV